MALALPLLAGLALAPLFGGRWRRLGAVRLRSVGLFYAAIALQIVAFPVSALPWHTPDGTAVVLWLVSYALFALGAARNLRLPGVPLLLVGMVSNLAAIIANGGHMPALPAALRAAGLHFRQSRNSTALSSPHLAWLVDRWAAPDWVPYANVYSVGDVLIAVGGLLFALSATGALARLRLPGRRLRLPGRRLRLHGRRRAPVGPDSGTAPAPLDADAIDGVQERIDRATGGGVTPAAVDATLERARDQIAALAAAAAELEATLPARIGDAVQDGLREQVLPVGRHIAEVRGLLARVIRGLEQAEIDRLAERQARADELSMLAELITAGRRGVEERLARIEGQLAHDDESGAAVYRLEGRQAS